MDERKPINNSDFKQDPKVTSQSFVARSLLVPNGFPRIGIRGDQPVVIDQADGVVRITPIHPVESADQHQREQGQVLNIIHALEEARVIILAGGDRVSVRAYVEDALAAAAELLKDLTR